MALNGNQTSTYYDIGFDEPYVEASTYGSNLVPGYYGIAIGGHPYAAETSFEPYRRDAFRSDSIEPIADKLDTNNIPGESSVNTEGLWRRGQVDWSLGSGQQFLDRDGSKPNRSYTTKGIYPWQQWQATLLNDTVEVHNSGTELQVITVGAYVYINDNGTIRYVLNSNLGNVNWSAVAGVTASTTSNALATDGNNVYIAAGSNGVYLITTPGSTAAQWLTGTVDNVWYASGWLLCAHNNLLYNPVVGTGTAGPTALTAAGPSAGTSLLFTHQNANFVWDCAAGGNSWVYAGGATSNTAANFSLIYKLQPNSTGTELTVPIIAATLPGGELVYTIYAYSNYIMVGTNLGARFCETLGINDPGGNAGDLKMGPIVPDLIQQVTKPVRCFTGQFRFIWFGWSNYDSQSTGIGRMDVSNFIDQQAPAYTSDLMVTGAGEILSMDWCQPSTVSAGGNIAGVQTGTPIFVVKGMGVYTAASNYVSSGVIDSGFVTYGIPDNKIGRFFDLDGVAQNNTGTVDTIAAYIVADQNLPGVSVTAQQANSMPSQVSIPNPQGQKFDVQVTLAGNNASTPTIYRWMMKAWPQVVSGTLHKVIINLFATVQPTMMSTDIPAFAYREFAFLDGLRQSQTPVLYQEGSQFLAEVVITNVTRLMYSEAGAPEGGYNQRIEVWLKTLDS